MENKGFITGAMALGLIIVSIVLALNIGRTDANNILSVTGSAEMTVVPDKAEMYVTVETTEVTAQLAQDKNSGLSNKVMDAMKGLGVKVTELESTQYTIQRKEVYDEKNGIYKLVGYTAMHTTKVSTGDISNTGKYIDAAVTAGANRVDRIDFTLTPEKEKQVKTDLLAKAALNANSKANSIAENMGVKLGRIRQISEAYYNIGPVNYYVNAKLDSMGSSTNIAPQQIVTSASISVSYQI